MKIKNIIVIVLVVLCFVVFPFGSKSSFLLAQVSTGVDYDPLVDVSVTVNIQDIRFFDKEDIQYHSRKYVDNDINFDFYVKIIINGEVFTSGIWQDTKYVRNANFSATVNVPDDEEFVNVTLQLWDKNTDGDVLLDIGNVNKDVTIQYSIKTGHWTGDDFIGDPSGYGRLNGCDDDSIYDTQELDCELWFTITQNDYDTDGIPYWVEENVYHTNPTVNDSMYDPNMDGIPLSWDWKWGYDSFADDNHFKLDPDNDGLDNYEEFLTAQWGSDPFRKDLFVELDQMADSPQGEKSIFPEESKELLYIAHDRQNVVYHLDDGSWVGSGSEMIPFDESTNFSEFDSIYDQYFLHGDVNNWRRGVFRYGVVIYQSSEVNGYTVGGNHFQISSHGLNEKSTLNRTIVFASAYMHETGHTLGFWPIPGHNRFSGYPWQLGWWLNRPYVSCMNYGYIFTMVDYSNGTRPFRDYNDWVRMNLTYFESE